MDNKRKNSKHLQSSTKIDSNETPLLKYKNHRKTNYAHLHISREILPNFARNGALSEGSPRVNGQNCP